MDRRPHTPHAEFAVTCLRPASAAAARDAASPASHTFSTLLESGSGTRAPGSDESRAPTPESRVKNPESRSPSLLPHHRDVFGSADDLLRKQEAGRQLSIRARRSHEHDKLLFSQTNLERLFVCHDVMRRGPGIGPNVNDINRMEGRVHRQSAILAVQPNCSPKRASPTHARSELQTDTELNLTGDGCGDGTSECRT